RTKAAPARADIAQQHERRCAMVPTFADIGALRRFTNRVQSKPAGQLFQLVKIFSGGSFGPEPGWLGLPDHWPNVNLHQLRGTAHVNILQEAEHPTSPRLNRNCIYWLPVGRSARPPLEIPRPFSLKLLRRLGGESVAVLNRFLL